MANSTQPIDGLVASTAEYVRDIADPAIKRSIENPEDGSLALAAFIALYHVKDWATAEGLLNSEQVYWANCPFGQVVAEIANGGKHARLTKAQYVVTPHVFGFQICNYGEGGYGVGPYGVANIQVNGIRMTGDTAQWWSIDEVLSDARSWWQATLGV